MMFITREDRMKQNYRKVEAMYRRDCSAEEIARSVKLPMMDVLDIMQKIFALDMSRCQTKCGSQQ